MGTLVDLTATVTDGATVEIITAKSPEALHIMRHSCAHIMAEAVQELYPGTQIAFGPATDDGYFYDFELPNNISSDDFGAIEKKMAEIVKADEPFVREVVSIDEAKKIFADQRFKLEHIDDLADEQITIYRHGSFVDLCSGPHIPSAGKIGAINIMSEASIGSGVRRVDAVVGQGAYEFNAREHALVSQLSDMVNARPDELAERVNMLLAKLKESDRRLAAMYESQLAASVPTLVAEAKASSAPVKVAKKNVGHFGSFDALRKTVLDVRGQLGEDAPVVVALAGMNEDGKPMVAVATNEAARKQGIKAGDLVRGASKVLGGGGGGKPDFAQGGGADATKIDEALEALAGQALKG